MLNVPISKNNKFIYCEDMELMLLALNILNEKDVHSLCLQICDSNKIETLKNKYFFLFEIQNSLDRSFKDGILEFLSDYDFQSFSLSSYKDYVRSYTTKEFVRRFLQLLDTDACQIPSAGDNSSTLSSFYCSHNYLFSSYLGFQAFIMGTERYIDEFFSLVEDLKSEEFMEVFSKGEQKARSCLKSTQELLPNMGSLEYSQHVMGKTFHNRGPYEKFIYCPSQLVRYRALRIFGVNQVLFYSIRQEALSNDNIVEKLKALGDSTRFRIISILGERGPIRGMDIAHELSLAPSTVSHHMEQLKKSGLITEEQVKNSKYYGLSHNSISEFIEKLTKTLSN